MGALSREQSIQLYGTEAYTGWPEEGAREDAKSKGISASSGSSSGAGSLSSFNWSVPVFDPNSIPVSQADPYFATQSVNIDDYIKAIQDTLPEPPAKYLEANPFYFDEQAARDVSTAEFAPYYDEILSDYLGEIKTTSEKNRGDAIRILTDLDKQKQTFMQQNGQAFDKTIRGIKEGYSGNGLYFSGFNKRDQNEASAANTNTLEGYLNTYSGKKAQTTADEAYQQKVLATNATNKARDVNRDKTAAIYGGINTQKNEAIDEYLYGMKTYYKNPNWKSIDPATLSINSQTGDTTQQQGTQY